MRRYSTAIGIVTPSNAVANVCGLLVLLVSVLCGGFLLNKQEPEAAAGGGGSFVVRSPTHPHRGLAAAAAASVSKAPLTTNVRPYYVAHVCYRS